MNTQTKLNSITNPYFRLLLLLFPILLMGTGCKQAKAPITDSDGKVLETNHIYPNVLCKADSVISYALYLPDRYDGKTKFPVIFLLDPHANGNLPITKYQTLANSYGYVFVASNDIKNGLPANYTWHLFQMMVNDVKGRYQIDSKRMYSGGFSGGAKLAIMFASQMPEITGVIACGASLPLTSDFTPTFYYAGIVGNQDFNYLETKQTFNVFDQWGYDYTAITFNGIHEWPPVDCFDMALCGIELNAMKTKRKETNNKWVEQVWSRMQDSISEFQKTNKKIDEFETLQQATRWFNGLKQVNDLKKTTMQLENDPVFVNQVRKLQSLAQKEVKLRSEYVRAIGLRDLDWWKAETARFEASSDEQTGLVMKRLRNYISMASYMLIKTDLDDSKLDDAIKKIQVYELVDPKNPDVFMMYARYYLLMDDTAEMAESYRKAKDVGFMKAEEYAKDPQWKDLMNQPDIKKLND